MRYCGAELVMGFGSSNQEPKPEALRSSLPLRAQVLGQKRCAFCANGSRLAYGAGPVGESVGGQNEEA